jgi:hypothetical protein
MSNSFEVRSRQGWGSRLGGAIKGVFVGGLMFVAAVPLLFWNEGRAVQTYKSLKEGAGAVVEARAEARDAALDGKLVHLTGMVQVDGSLRDAQFGIERRALRLERTVEMFQWQESSSTKEEKKVGGSVERVTTYTYDTGWSERLIDSADFKQPEGRANPTSMPFETQRWDAQSGRLGDFHLDAGVLGKVGGWQDQAVAVDELPAELREGFVAQGGWLYRSSNPAQPRVGDLRVRFRMVPEQVVSVIARQDGNGLAAYQTQAGDALLMVSTGEVPAAQMFEAAQAANTMFTWFIRGVGFLLMWIGLGMVFRPLSVLMDVLPFLGTIVGKGIGFVSFILAAIAALVVIAVAWIVYRPLLAISLLAAVVALVVWLVKKKRKPVEAAPAPA